MIIIKLFILALIFLAVSGVGILIAGKYKGRVKELREMKKGLNMLETKIKFTYEPLPEIFQEIANTLEQQIGNIFRTASIKMNQESAKQAWEDSIEIANTNMKVEDLEILKGLGKLLGKTALEGQVSEIELTNSFLDTQIQKAQKECEKNEKLYKTLGMVTGLALVILLI